MAKKERSLLSDTSSRPHSADGWCARPAPSTCAQPPSESRADTMGAIFGFETAGAAIYEVIEVTTGRIGSERRDN